MPQLLLFFFTSLAAAQPPAGPAQPVCADSAAPSTASASPGPIVIWPNETFKYPTLKRSFTLGNVPPGSELAINGATVAVRPSGAFLAMVDLATGTFRLAYDARAGGASTTCVRTVAVEAPYGSSLKDFEAMRPLEPSTTIQLRVGETVVVRALGPPGLSGRFEIRRLAKDLPLVEKNGVYEGHYRIQPGDKGKELAVRFTLRGKGWKKFKAEAPGKVTVFDAGMYRVAVTSAPITTVKSGVGGYTFFLSPGISLAVIGQKGPLYHVELSDSEDGWVGTDRVILQPEGTPPPVSLVGQFISTSVDKDAVRVHLTADKRIPFDVRQSVDPLTFEIRFYGGQQRVETFHYASDDPVVSEVTWRQEGPRTAVFIVHTRLAWGWGYDAYYDKGRFVLEIRRPPLLPRGLGVLAGRKIAIDPGHGPELQAVGPMGSSERDNVLAISEKLKTLFEKEGASVYMVRTSSEGPPLQDRPVLAWRQHADLFLSVHANALPVDGDPVAVPRGYMIFYYLPQSRPFADAVHRSYQRFFTELADEFVRWGNLLVCRTTQMPAILVESAYMIVPEQEEMLREPKGQESFAEALLEGVKDYYEEYRQLQLRSSAEQRAARE